MEVRADIKTSLHQIGKSCADLARYLGKSYEVINRYINGRAKMPPDIEEAINKFLENNGI